MEWTGYKKGQVYKASQLADALKEAFEEQQVDIVEDNRVFYYNCPASFDIETSSFYNEDGEKRACMYIWQMGFNGTVIYGRTWEEWLNCLEQLVDYLQLDETHRLIIYVHNLGYEFQFIRKFFDWDKVFAIKQRRPVYALCKGLEFRCSLFLSNYALAYIGDNLLHKYPVKKLVGDLDYSKLRHSKTPLTEQELAYCINDVKVVMSYIQEKIEQDGDITKIPLTNTGYVRNYCRKECFFEGIPEDDEEGRKRVLMNYRAIMKSLQIESKEEYEQMQRAFMGGFTHASALYSGKTMYDVGSADLTSSYPYAMVAQYYPMTKGEFIGKVEDDKLFNYYLNKYCCLFDVEFTNLKPSEEYENPLSYSRCKITGNYIVNNGRVVSADKMITTLTELDFDTVQKFYTWDSIKVFNMRIYQRGYLPRALIIAVLDLYEKKTSLKGIEGKEIEYLVSKNMINAAFGMMVTAVVRDEYNYSDKGSNILCFRVKFSLLSGLYPIISDTLYANVVDIHSFWGDSNIVLNDNAITSWNDAISIDNSLIYYPSSGKYNHYVDLESSRYFNINFGYVIPLHFYRNVFAQEDDSTDKLKNWRIELSFYAYNEFHHLDEVLSAPITFDPFGSFSGGAPRFCCNVGYLYSNIKYKV